VNAVTVRLKPHPSQKLSPPCHAKRSQEDGKAVRLAKSKHPYLVTAAQCTTAARTTAARTTAARTTAARTTVEERPFRAA
jgi:hypothetical protein